MERLFTDFVLRLMREDRTLTLKDVEDVLQALKKALRRELRRRGLWDSPPSYLGVLGEAWEDWAGADALGELAGDCFSYVFVTRLQSLAAQTRVKDNVEGLVHLNIRHFFYERQRRNDPLGFRAYRAFNLATELGVDEGWLFRQSGGPRLSNDSLIAFSPTTGGELRPPEDLQRLISHWPHELLPALAVGSGRVWTTVVRRFAGLVKGLRETGTAALRVGDLLAVLKPALRRHWASIVAAELGTSADAHQLRDTVLPDLSFEEQQHFATLERQVEDELGRLEVDPRTRGFLLTLWRYLTQFASDSDGPEAAPSGRSIARETSLPRKRLPELLATIADVVTVCRNAPAPIERRQALDLHGDD